MSTPKRLFRRSSEGRLAGVCAGLAEYLDFDVTLVRVFWIVLSIVPGGIVGGLVAYAVAWFAMPDEPGRAPAPSTRRLMRSTTNRKIAGVCAGLAEYFELDPTVVRVLWAILSVFPGGIVLGIVAYFVGWFVMPVPHHPPVVVLPTPA